MSVTDSFDLNTLLADVVIKYGEETVTPVINKVVYGEEEFTTGFDTFDLSNKGTYVIYYGATHGDLSVEKSFTLVIKSTNNITNGDFEAGSMAGWTLLTGDEIAENPVTSNATFWGEEISLNQGGNYHFDGWTATGSEPAGYSYKSENFSLSGTGMISFKLGGKAAKLNVYLADGTKICEFDNPNFADVAFPSLGNGCRLATMNSYYYDLSAYLGSEMYVVIEDAVMEGGWTVAFFDDINFYYEAEVDFASKVDVVLESKLPDVEEREEVSLPWTLAINLVTEDSSEENTDSEVE